MDEDNLSAEDFLRLVGGSLCPCGHDADKHAAPDPNVEGETMGACRECDCKGVVEIEW